MLRTTTLFLTVTALASGVPACPAQDLTRIPRTIGKQPRYRSEPRYCLLVFGPRANERAWLVLDGDTLYVDRHGTGDLTLPECQVKTTADHFFERLFEAGDLIIGTQCYASLQVRILAANESTFQNYQDMPLHREFLASHRGMKLYSIGIEVPLSRPLPDIRDGNPLKSVRQSAGEYDAHGFLQFSTRPEDAPVIHFGEPWTLWPDGQQRLTRGRSEDLVLRAGTPGHGPGTFASIPCDRLIPASAQPHLRIEFPMPADREPLVRNYTLADRC